MLLIAALLLYGLLLTGIDAAQKHLQMHEASESNPATPIATDNGCYYAAGVPVVDSPIRFQGS